MKLYGLKIKGTDTLLSFSTTIYVMEDNAEVGFELEKYSDLYYLVESKSEAEYVIDHLIDEYFLSSSTRPMNKEYFGRLELVEVELNLLN